MQSTDTELKDSLQWLSIVYSRDDPRGHPLPGLAMTLVVIRYPVIAH